VKLHDGSTLWLKKLERDHDIHSKAHAASVLREAREKGQILTGLFYWNQQSKPFTESLRLTSKPLAHLSEDELRPPNASLEMLLERFI
jgi:2-oxoglutarate ferredoxin oxidoreductase subunit beta